MRIVMHRTTMPLRRNNHFGHQNHKEAGFQRGLEWPMRTKIGFPGKAFLPMQVVAFNSLSSCLPSNSGFLGPVEKSKYNISTRDHVDGMQLPLYLYF